MMKVAVIGGIGSGKSQVMLAFEKVGYTVLSADKINAELWEREDYIDTLKTNFPEAVEDGVITKQSLSRVVFADEGKRELLNSISHPLILDRIKKDNSALLAVELPLAVESGMLDEFDHVVLVDTKKRLRLKRLEGRGVDKKRAKKIMSVQVPIKELKRWSDVILVNNGTVDEIEKKAIFIAEALAL